MRRLTSKISWLSLTYVKICKLSLYYLTLLPPILQSFKCQFMISIKFMNGLNFDGSQLYLVIVDQVCIT